MRQISKRIADAVKRNTENYFAVSKKMLETDIQKHYEFQDRFFNAPAGFCEYLESRRDEFAENDDWETFVNRMQREFKNEIK